VRIIRGIYKTRRFKVPKGFPSRPTTDFAKEGLFNMLEHNYLASDLKILDLCAGTGNISIEFLSREVGTVVSVDNNYNCVRHIKTISKEYGCENNISVIKSDIIKYLKNSNLKFDIIFADPPYAFTRYDEITSYVFEKEMLAENGVLIIEHGKETSLEHITQFDFERIFGNVHFSFFESKQEE